MPYFLIQDFSHGLDTRKSNVSLPPGSLRYANNVHVTRGGELQKRKAFVPYMTLPPGSVGLASDRDNLIVFGNGDQTLGLNVQWVNCGGVPSQLMDSTRWSDTAVSTVLMADGTRRLIYGASEVTNWSILTEGDVPATKPGPVRTYRGKIYGAEGELVYGSALFDPNTWDIDEDNPAATGSFFFNASQQSETMARINALSIFQGSLVVFSEDGIQVWNVDPDPDKNYLLRSLTNTGCLSPRTVLNFGNFDVVFLAKSGVRSLQARAQTDIMNVQDIGTPIDDFVSQLIARFTVPVVRYKAFSVVEPESACLWMSLGDTILVHSFYEGSEISAWSTYTPGFTVDGMATVGAETYVRASDTIYLYGGASHAMYDMSKAEIWTPYHHADKPATKKIFTGFDIGCSGTWTVKVATDPNQADVTELVSTVTNTTFDEPNQALANWGTHLSVVLESTDPGPVTVANLAMHYNEGVAA